MDSDDALPGTMHAWPDEHSGPWTLHLGWRVIRGRAECVELTMTSLRSPRGGAPTPRPLTSALLRSLRIGRLIEEDRADMAEFTSNPDVYTKPPTMRQETFERLQRVAEVYLEAAPRGRPTKTVAAQLQYSESAAAKLVARAREVGLIPPTQRGVAAYSRRGTNRES